MVAVAEGAPKSRDKHDVVAGFWWVFSNRGRGVGNVEGGGENNQQQRKEKLQKGGLAEGALSQRRSPARSLQQLLVDCRALTKPLVWEACRPELLGPFFAFAEVGLAQNVQSIYNASAWYRVANCYL